ncbi:MAG: flagellar biosynthesis protein FliQ [Gammaproteobacteria bacterium]|nr:flagellar biosynthesis protein FliQ [Gammaproteobacteria bacterium]
MSPETVLTVFQQTLEMITVLTMIILLPALGVGLLVAMFQAATQINEMTLTFIPKLLITFGVLMYAGPYMLGVLVDFTKRLIEDIPNLIG